MPGSEPRPCTSCGRPVWLSPSGLAAIAKPGRHPSCVYCIDPSDVQSVDIVPGMIEELREALGPTLGEVSDEVLRKTISAVVGEGIRLGLYRRPS